MNREEAGELLEVLKVLWPTAKLPGLGDWKGAEAYKSEAASIFEAYMLEEVRNAYREQARASEWLPSTAAILRTLEAKTGTQGKAGAKAYQFEEWTTDAEGYEAVRTYTIVKGADGGMEIPKPILRKYPGNALRRELLKRRILTTADMVRLAETGELSEEDFITSRDADGKPLGEWKLDHYTAEPERVLAALNAPIRPRNAVLSDEKREEVQDTVYSFFERITADDIPF